MNAMAKSVTVKIDLEIMIKEEFKQWWRKYDTIEKCRLISKKANEIKSLELRRKKALDREIDHGFNRIGIRGGKFTSLAARSESITKLYLSAIEEIQYMCSTL